MLSVLCVLLLMLLSTPLPTHAVEPTTIPMGAEQWQPANAGSRLEFIPYEGFPQGILGVRSGDATLKGVHFANGTIEFDLKAIGEDMAGIRFHQHGQDTADIFYLRLTPNCPAAQDCMQYTIFTHGHWLWDSYPQYQKPGPVNSAAWNHVKLVLSGRRMKVYLNREAVPSLVIGRLEGDALDGELQFTGPAYFANLVLTPPGGERRCPPPPPAPPPAPPPPPRPPSRGILRRDSGMYTGVGTG